MSTMTEDRLVLGRDAYARQAWGAARDHLAAADAAGPVAPEDLDLLATAAYLSGRFDAADEAWARAYRGFVERDELTRALRCSFWLALTLMQRGEWARAAGWLRRGQELQQKAALEGAERGYLQIPAALQALNGGEPATAAAEFARIGAIADRSGDADLRALSLLGHGQALVLQGDATRGIALLDEAMLAATTGEVSTMTAGIVYCGVIVACRKVFDLRRAQEWTAALSRWCAGQQDLKPFRGQCLVHRAQIMQLRGQWTRAIDEVRQASAHLADPPGDPVLGMALYELAELLRLRGEFTLAEETYRRASQAGHPVQPGLALLRLAQGRVDDAMGAMRRLVAEAEGPVDRAHVLDAYVETALAAGDAPAAREAIEELAKIAADFDSPYLRAVVDYGLGSVLLADGDPLAARAALGRAFRFWQELDAPYEAARVRVRMAEACRYLGDHDTAAMELDAAGRVFARLGAAPLVARVRELAGSAPPQGLAGLTARELQVLRLVATGATNRQIADTLVISDKTVARHVSNLFTKLGLSSRAAATAYAHRHHLV